MNYSEITSAYIRNLLRNTPWQDHDRIDSLISLHGYILNPPRNWSGGLAFTHLKSQYRTEYLELLREHSPEALATVLLEEQAMEVNSINQQSEFDTQEIKKRTSWLLAGGKP